MVLKGPYVIVTITPFVLFVPTTLKLTVWLGFFKVTADGKGGVSITYDDRSWSEKGFSQKYWWIPCYPFVCVPRDANGGFWLYNRGSYWFIRANDKAIVTCNEVVPPDWNTFTGKQLLENTRPECV